MGGISGKATAATVALVILVLGFFLFPNLNTYISGISTTGWGTIIGGIKTFLPYIVIGVVLLICFFLFKGKDA